ncbi:MAG: hypothetical protein OHK0039_23150 [Bacteroidia bacterium]
MKSLLFPLLFLLAAASSLPGTAQALAGQSAARHCDLQAYLLEVLIYGEYRVYDADGRTTSLDAALGGDHMVEELRYFETYSGLWPMYEELCVRTDFDVVLLGTLQPGGTLRIFGIEWEADAIRLYETFTPDDSEDGLFPLMRGALAFYILPASGQWLPGAENIDLSETLHQ